ncbi:AAA family ATPase [Cytobacillus praedii]|uniref:AAA family ATPase n=1 Tax=Cytobacillus praedii TaxID=1742358 RepID=UPI003AF7CB0D
MNRIDLFPFDLHVATIEEKKNYFIERTINHPRLNQVYLDVMDKVNNSSKGKVYLVFGPTGVGKSTVCSKVRDNVENTNHNRSLIPVASLELPSPDNGKFNWKDFYKRLLKEMNEPLIDQKIIINNKEEKQRPIPNYVPTTAPELRQSLENAIKYRKTKVILLDEAQHLLKVASAKSIRDHMDALKSIANLTGVVFFMFGTYELMDFFDLNGQLGRRTNEIHFSRYDMKRSKDKKEFKSVINTFQCHLPFTEETNLVQYWEFLYERSIGCIGILKEWLNECLKEALNKNQLTISYELLQKHAPSPTKALRIAEETIDGEERLEKQEEDLQSLKIKLGFKEEDNKKHGEEEKKSKKKSPGKRTPTRDDIGIKESGA